MAYLCQLESFDLRPDHDVVDGITAIDTAVAGIRLAAGLERQAEQISSL